MKHAILFLIAALASIAFAAIASGDTRDIAGTTITLQDTDEPGAIAEIEFYNRPVNTRSDNHTFTLTHRTLTVSVTFYCDPSAEDTITVSVPAGYVAYPETIDVAENTGGTIYIRVFELMGV